MADSTEGELLHTKSVLEREANSLLEAIRELRQRARQKSIEAAATRSPLPEAEIRFWQENISKHQTELMVVQGKIGETNRALREARRSSKSGQSRANGRTRDSKGLVADSGASADAVDADLFLSCFHTIAEGSLDPRQFAALEAGAFSLARDHQRMQKGGG